ncbi:hypothetical protein ACOME3_001943 [Neoechinorhynchus agilis]
MSHSRKSSTHSHDDGDESYQGNRNQRIEGNSSETSEESIILIGAKGRRINASPEKRLKLREIYSWLEDNNLYFNYRMGPVESRPWKNAIRHCLTINKKFVKIEDDDNPRRSWWTIDPNYREPEPKRPGRKRTNPGSMNDDRNKRARSSFEPRDFVHAAPHEMNRTVENSNAAYFVQGICNNSTNIGNRNEQLGFGNMAPNGYLPNHLVNLRTTTDTNIGNRNEQLGFGNMAPNGYFPNQNLNLANNHRVENTNAAYLVQGICNNSTNIGNRNEQLGFGNMAPNGYFPNQNLNLANNHRVENTNAAYFVQGICNNSTNVGNRNEQLGFGNIAPNGYFPNQNLNLANNPRVANTNAANLVQGIHNNSTNIGNRNEQLGFGNMAPNGYFPNQNLDLANNHRIIDFGTQQNSAPVENINIGGNDGNFRYGNTAILQNGLSIQTNQRVNNSNQASQMVCHVNICVDPNHSHEMSQFLLVPLCQRCGEIKALNSGVLISQEQAMIALQNYNINQQNNNQFNPIG